MVISSSCESCLYMLLVDYFTSSEANKVMVLKIHVLVFDTPYICLRSAHKARYGG